MKKLNYEKSEKEKLQSKAFHESLKNSKIGRKKVSIKEESDDIKNQKMKINDLENDLLQAEKDEDKEKADGLKKDIESEKETLKSMKDSESMKEEKDGMVLFKVYNSPKEAEEKAKELRKDNYYAIVDDKNNKKVMISAEDSKLYLAGKKPKKESVIKENKQASFSIAIDTLNAIGKYSFTGYKEDDAPVGKVKQYLEKEKIPFMLKKEDNNTLTFYTSISPEFNILIENAIKEDTENEADYVPIDDSIREKIVNFLSTVKVQKDDQIHEFADSLGLNKHQVEEEIYKLVQCILLGGRSKEKDITEFDVNPEEYEKGLVVEVEHCDINNPYAKFISKKIDLDHLAEIEPPMNSKYYTNLAEMEDEMENEEKIEEGKRYSSEFQSLLNSLDTQASTAETLGRRYAMNPEAIYNWAKDNKVDLVMSGHILYDPSKADLTRAVLNNTVDKSIKGMSSLTFKENQNLEEAVDVKKVIKDLQGNFSGSNEDQMKSVQLLKGVATSNEPISNEFMKKVDTAITKISKEVLGEKKEENIEEQKELSFTDPITYKSFIQRAKEAYGDIVARDQVETLFHEFMEISYETAEEDFKEKLDWILEEVNSYEIKENDKVEE
jgi:hypothetical protein